SGVEVGDPQGDGIGNDIQVKLLCLRTKRRVEYRSVDVAGLQSSQPLGLVADLQDRHVFWIDTRFLQKHACAELGRGAEASYADTFAFQVNGILDLAACDKLVAHPIVGHRDINNVPTAKVRGDARRARQLTQINVAGNHSLNRGATARHINDSR